MVGETLADDALERFGGAGAIIKAVSGAGVIAELEFRQIAMKVLLPAVLIDALHPVLKNRERAFHGVGADGGIIADIAAEAVEGGAVSGELAADFLIHLGLVSHKPGFAADVGAHDRMDLVGAILELRARLAWLDRIIGMLPREA